MFAETFLQALVKVQDTTGVKGARFSHSQRVILSSKGWRLLARVRRRPRKRVQRNLRLMRSLCNLDESEIRINPRLGGRTRYFQHRPSFDDQTAAHLRLLTIGIEHQESDFGVSRSQFRKRFL